MKRRDLFKAALLCFGAAVAPKVMAKVVSPERQKFHPSQTKAWVQFAYFDGVSIVSASNGIAYVKDIGPGQILIQLLDTADTALVL